MFIKFSADGMSMTVSRSGKQTTYRLTVPWCVTSARAEGRG
jgi:hypothetical protein